MEVDMNGVIFALSYALDKVESELIGVDIDHAKWVAYMSVLTGKTYDMSFEQLSDLAACAAMHDNALTQYNAGGRDRGLDPSVFGLHCTFGQENIAGFPFYGDTTDFITYHHENADGTGLFHKNDNEVPLAAKIIHLADMVDVSCKVKDVSVENYKTILNYLNSNTDQMFPRDLVQHFLTKFTEEFYLSLKGRSIKDLLSEELPHNVREYPFEQVRGVMNVFGQIVDCKSSFTRNHSFCVADKVTRMARFYGCDDQIIERIYIAGVLHDIGKMAINNDILEKPARLSETEFAYMQNHAWYTYVILSQIRGFEDITEWASLHHEKLNGTGYPFGKTGKDLSKTDRLLACVDIYQALSEDRPYKKGMEHTKCIDIMRDMASKGLIDAEITEDVNTVFQVAPEVTTSDRMI